MNILYITHCDPRDTNFGSAQRSHHLWEALKKFGNVYTVYNVGPAEIPVNDEVHKIRSACFAPKGFWALHVFSFINGKLAPFVWPFRRWQYLRDKMPWKDVAFDMIVVRYLGNVALTNAWKFGKVYVDVDDLPSESFNTIRRRRMPPPFGWMGSMIVSWWQKYILKKCKAAWIASPDQVEEISRICPCSALPNLPLPVSDAYKVNGAQKKQIMTVGLMSYEPNCQGVNWFVDNVWPVVHEKIPDLVYRICGGGVPERLCEKWAARPGVEVAGFVKDIDKVYEESIAVVTPIWSGAGTCIKVPEAVLRGRKVFATPFAVRGLSGDVIATSHINTSSEPNEMASRIIEWIEKDQQGRIIEQLSIFKSASVIFSQDVYQNAVSSVLMSEESEKGLSSE